ncbi:MAG: FIST C-terminal domain-containing protein [Kiritimatiellae bacterium]|nr:FIST C-terminal domain-containing protein [Kiritimatiellia bacterium]
MNKLMICMTAATAAILTGCMTANKTAMTTPPAKAGGAIIMKTAMVEEENAFQAGVTAATKLKTSLKGAQPHAILMVDCYDSKTAKQQAIAGVATIFSKELIFGGAVYGMYTQEGALDTDGLSLLALAGDGIQVQAALTEKMGAAGLSLETEKDAVISALNAGGANLAGKIANASSADFMIVMADAHSPKNQYLIDGIQKVAGKELPITGGSCNKNAGLTYIYYRGALYKDAAVALAISGEFKVAQSGRQAKSNDKVISTAKEGAATAVKALKAKPMALIAYDCAGRMGKVKNLDDELNAIKGSVAPSVPIFGCYCAGEFGPADSTLNKSDGTSTGRGWHVMFSVMGK